MAGHATPNDYIKTWAILVVLLIISVVGPMLGHPTLTLITAFGIAVVKALMVARRFMHINECPAFITYIMVTALVFMVLFFAGTSPDVMKEHGDNWVKGDGWHFEDHRLEKLIESGHAVGHH